tara:strand:- start:392 stop:1132 length:741 start_codon:yes stop_codon:yes gene_type:complete
MFKKQLKDLGLTENEVKIYLTLLENGHLHPTKLAEKTGLHRSYLYDALERLVEKGVLNLIILENKRAYQAVDPSALRELFELKLKQFDSILPELNEIFREQKEETRVEVYKGKQVFRTCIKDLVSNLKKNDTLYLMGEDEEITQELDSVILKQYFRILKEKNVKEKVIIRKGAKKLPEKAIEYRELPSKYIGDVMSTIHNNKVYLFVMGNPHHLITIESKKIVQSYLKQFNLLWKIAGSKTSRLLN